MGGFVSSVVSVAKSCYNSVKSFVSGCYQSASYVVHSVGQSISNTVTKAKEFYNTKVNGTIKKVVKVVSLVTCLAIGTVLVKSPLGLLVDLILFIGIYITNKILFSPVNRKQVQKSQEAEQKDNSNDEQRNESIAQFNINYENNAPDFDRELKKKAFDHSKEFLENVKSFIQEMEEFKGLDYPPKRYLYHFTLDGVKSIMEKEKKDDEDIEEDEEEEEEKEEENDNSNKNGINEINNNENNNNRNNKVNNNINNNDNNNNEMNIINNNENNNINFNENNNNKNDKGNERHNKDKNKERKNNENRDENQNENNDIARNEERDENKNDNDDFDEKKDIKENVLVSLVWFEYNSHYFILKFTNEISNEEMNKKIMHVHINNLRIYLGREYEVKFNEVEDDNWVEEDINKIDNIKTLDIVITKNEY